MIIDFLIGYASSFPKSRFSIFFVLILSHCLLCALILHLLLGGGILSIFFKNMPFILIGFIIICGRMYYELLILTGQQSLEQLNGSLLPNYPVVLILFLLFLILVKWFRKINTLKGFVLSEICLLLITSMMVISLIGIDA